MSMITLAAMQMDEKVYGLIAVLLALTIFNYYRVCCLSFVGFTTHQTPDFGDIEDMSEDDDDTGTPPGTTAFKRTNFRSRVLRRLRETCHIDEWENTPTDRRILKKKVVTIMRKFAPDIRDADIYSNGDVIVEMFFIPTHMDMECREIRYSSSVRMKQERYNRKIWVGTFWDYVWGRSRWIDPAQKSL